MCAECKCDCEVKSWCLGTKSVDEWNVRLCGGGEGGRWASGPMESWAEAEWSGWRIATGGAADAWI